jgi:hypothetical protein
MSGQKRAPMLEWWLILYIGFEDNSHKYGILEVRKHGNFWCRSHDWEGGKKKIDMVRQAPDLSSGRS